MHPQADRFARRRGAWAVRRWSGRLAVLLCGWTITAAAADAGSWTLYPFVGIGTDGGIQHLPAWQADFLPSYLYGLALARDLGTGLRGAVAFEIEVQGARHFNYQTHYEANAVLVIRWRRFPWNDRLRTSLAVGEGVSYATHIPAIERDRGQIYSRFLNYILFELELAPPRSPWSLAARIHHRSGVGGLYNGATKGSNFVTSGVRRRF